MARGRGNAFVFALAVLALLQAAVAKDYTVGDAHEWSYPPGTDSTYYTDTWAAKQSFAPGDNLVFKYPVGGHDVQIVSAAEYAGCLASNGKQYISGSDTIPLPKAGDYFFVCNLPTHCDQGMKMKVTVKAAGGTPPAVAPVAPPPKATPPPAVAPATPPPVVVLPPPVKAPPPAPVAKAPAPAPVAKAPAPAPVAKAPAPAPVAKAPAPAPVAVPVSAPVAVPVSAPVAVPVSAPVDAPTPPGVVSTPPAPAIAPTSSGSSLRVCLSFVAVAAIAALLV